MMFSCCHPRLAEEAQVALILNILCGFGAPEIAARVPGQPRGDREAPVARQEGRSPAARRAVRSVRRRVRRAPLRRPARALSALQRGLPRRRRRVRGPGGAVRGGDPAGRAARASTRQRPHPRRDALAALMYLHAARLPARLDAAGDFNPLFEQDRSRWDQPTDRRGPGAARAIRGGSDAYRLSRRSGDCRGTRQRAIGRRDRLGADRLALRPADGAWPLARRRPQSGDRGRAAGRAGSRAGCADAPSTVPGQLARYPFYAAARGELELRCGRPDAARTQFAAALALARNPAERRFLDKRLAACAMRQG